MQVWEWSDCFRKKIAYGFSSFGASPIVWSCPWKAPAMGSCNGLLGWKSWFMFIIWIGRSWNTQIRRLHNTSRKDYKTDGCKIVAAVWFFPGHVNWGKVLKHDNPRKEHQYHEFAGCIRDLEVKLRVPAEKSKEKSCLHFWISKSRASCWLNRIQWRWRVYFKATKWIVIQEKNHNSKILLRTSSK